MQVKDGTAAIKLLEDRDELWIDEWASQNRSSHSHANHLQLIEWTVNFFNRFRDVGHRRGCEGTEPLGMFFHHIGILVVHELSGRDCVVAISAVRQLGGR